ncbi:MAG: hypothetical protein AAB691_03255 [Patescibacteria group bacterium]
MTERSFWGGILIAIVVVFSVGMLTSAFNGPTQGPPNGDGAIQTDTVNRVGINIPPGTFRVNIAGGDLGLSTSSQIDFFDENGDKIFWHSTALGTGVEGGNSVTSWIPVLGRFRWQTGGTTVGAGTDRMTLSTLGLTVFNPGYVSSTQFCLSGTCIANWSAAGGGGGSGSSTWIISGANMYATTTVTIVAVTSTANFGVGTYTPGSNLTVRRSSAGTAFAVRNTGDTANTFLVTDAGAVLASGAITATGNIVTNGVFQRNTSSGISVSCAVGQVVASATVSGGIITAGTCVTIGGAVYQ